MDAVHLLGWRAAHNFASSEISAFATRMSAVRALGASATNCADG